SGGRPGLEPGAGGLAALAHFRNIHNPPPGEIKVETDLYEATFATAGGTLTSMRLKSFQGRDDKPVDLVREKTPGELGLVVVSPTARASLNSIVFSAADSVDASTGRIRKLRFYALDTSGASVEKTYAFADDSYVIGLDIKLTGMPPMAEKLECLLGWSGGLSLSDRNAKEELHNIASVSLLGTEMFRDDLNSFKKTPVKEHTGNVRWAGVRSRYFLAAVVPPEGAVSRVMSHGNPDKSFSGTQIALPVSPSGTADIRCILYVGPIDFWRLKALGVELERTVNMGWSWIRPLSQAILWFLVFCHKAIPNYGIVAIILSALTKILFYPLTKSSMKSMRNMQRLQPEIQKLKEKLKKDPQKLNKEVMGLYKKHKVNPLGGCLPLLLQMPVFIALYNVLMNSIEMRQAHFVWWISDLSSPDTVAVIAGFSIHVLPIIMAGSMFWQQKMTPTDPRQAAMTYFMPILMLFFFYGLPSGLVLYWTANNLMTIAQQYVTQRSEGAKEVAQEAERGEGDGTPEGNKAPAKR
ncbi:MAG: membrane protein insertase YidC, partial [Candidatus Eisenbacteria bacterium]